MKKTLISLLVFGLAFAFINAQSIVVTSPASGDNWYFNEGKRITWTRSGEQNGLVKIRLFNEAGVRVLSIADRTNNDGIYEWTVPNTLPAGNYMIRVKTVDDLVSDDSNFFNISESFVSTDSISISVPNSSTSIYTTHVTLAITWNSSGEIHENVSISVFPEGSSSPTIITMSTPNDDSFHWDSPGALVGSGRYYVRVKTFDGAVWGDSEIFEILATTPPRVAITVDSPDSRAEWTVNVRRMIGWQKVGEMDDHVKIKIYNEAGAITLNVTDNTENDESHTFFLPDTHPTGRHFVRVTTADNEVTDDSEIFNIIRLDERGDPPPDTPPESRNKINVKSPNSRSVWNSGQKVNIMWAKNTIVHTKVKIELFRERRLRAVKVISSRTDNDGTFSWKIPAGITSGRHIIKVTTLNNRAYGLSEIFVLNMKKIIPRKK